MIIWNNIKHNYNLNNAFSYFDGDYEFVKCDGILYLVSRVENVKLFNNLYTFFKNNTFFYKMICNNFGKVVTYYNNDYYVLLVYEKRNSDIRSLICNYDNFKSLIRGRCNWRDSWLDRSDYIERYYKFIVGKYACIDESIDYYYSMLELAIYYLRDCSYDSDLYIQHSYCKLDEFTFYNPCTVKLDVKERDFSNYLKYLFFSGMYEYVDVLNIIIENIDRYDFNFVIARLIYPDYYFELFDKLVCCDCDSELDAIIEEVRGIALKVYEYEKYIISIYETVSLKKDIKKVDFFNLH